MLSKDSQVGLADDYAIALIAGRIKGHAASRAFALAPWPPGGTACHPADKRLRKPLTYERLSDVPPSNPQVGAEPPEVAGLGALGASPARAGNALERRLAAREKASQSRLGLFS